MLILLYFQRFFLSITSILSEDEQKLIINANAFFIYDLLHKKMPL